MQDEKMGNKNFSFSVDMESEAMCNAGKVFRNLSQKALTLEANNIVQVSLIFPVHNCSTGVEFVFSCKPVTSVSNWCTTFSAGPLESNS